jgi:membrane protease YdiL (CAAX protease family)
VTPPLSSAVGSSDPQSEARLGQGPVVLATWLLTLAVSILPDVISRSVTGGVPGWLFPAKLVGLAAIVATGFLWKAVTPLRAYSLVMSALLLLEWLRSVLEGKPWWNGMFAGGFGQQMLGTQILRVGAAAVMIVLLLVLRFRSKDFYLVRGNPNAKAEPVRWLGIDKPIGWNRLGMISALCISLGTLAFLVLAGQPPPSAAAGAVTLLPMILLLAAMNAFGEEVTFRGALLAPLVPSVGPRHAVMLTAAFFGLGHYYGVPYGIIGVAMASLLGWFLGKCMVETRGFFWPWFIHFLQDVMIFYFMAIGAVVAGGR